MSQRLNAAQVAPDAFKALMGVEMYVRLSGLEQPLIELVRLRASYMNGCAYCVDMHTKDARAAGETEQRLFGVPVWRETSYFTERERAALEWAEAVTSLSQGAVSDSVYENVRGQFNERELVDLTMAVIAINAWNRAAIAFRTEPGSYQRPVEIQSGA
ncbi:MAG: carboxymuconolactone decarboxylase family protein [Gemmatimonadaceae bacterium]|nr:carboxymuconolactone decarboxylase family protein [Gemmatimonadaceae bacterium]